MCERERRAVCPNLFFYFLPLSLYVFLFRMVANLLLNFMKYKCIYYVYFFSRLLTLTLSLALSQCQERLCVSLVCMCMHCVCCCCIGGLEVMVLSKFDCCVNVFISLSLFRRLHVSVFMSSSSTIFTMESVYGDDISSTYQKKSLKR